MPNLNHTRRQVCAFVDYELKHMIADADDAGHVPAPDMSDHVINHLSTDQRDELTAKLIDLAKFIRATP